MFTHADLRRRVETDPYSPCFTLTRIQVQELLDEFRRRTTYHPPASIADEAKAILRTLGFRR